MLHTLHIVHDDFILKPLASLHPNYIDDNDDDHNNNKYHWYNIASILL